MTQTSQRILEADLSSSRLADTISDRLSQELLVALVGPVGSGVSTAARYIEDILVQDFGYAVAPTIKPSDIIRAEAHRVEIVVPEKKPLDEYIDKMQTAGNELRKKFGPNYLAEKAVEKIVLYRKENSGYDKKGQTQLPGRRAYIIDSIKNMEELELLRHIYHDTLCVIGVFAPDKPRKERLINKGVDKAGVQKILDRDEGEVATFGQMTRKVFVESDFFICNDQKEEELRRRIARYLQIVFDASIHTPTLAESAMYKANAVASNSACMSRQVGAAIMSKSGELISVGWNDVPKFGGSLYGEDDQYQFDKEKSSIQDTDHRCFKWGRKICHNEVRRNDILDKMASEIATSDLVKKKTTQAAIRNLLRGTEVDSLIEFSRSIHAEMEAILAVAREGRHSLVGATLYTTTYPCHNCARHIVASGIARVIYIQPYKKSLAIDLHNDSVTEDPYDNSHVVFQQYDGVAPCNFLKLFSAKTERKKDGKLLRTSPKSAVPVFRIPLDAPMEYESKVIADLSNKEQNEIEM